MKIKMLKTTTGSNDGKVTETFNEGQEYEVSDELGNAFIEMEVAEEVKGEGDVEKDAKAKEGKEDKAHSQKDYANKGKDKF